MVYLVDVLKSDSGTRILDEDKNSTTFSVKLNEEFHQKLLPLSSGFRRPGFHLFEQRFWICIVMIQDAAVYSRTMTANQICY